MTKQIDNEYYKKFCSVVESFDSGAVKKCSSTMKEASYDDKNNYYVYFDHENNQDFNVDMTIFKLDDFSEIYNPKNIYPAVDAVCIDSKNNWYLIEFKNQKFNDAKSSVKKKMMGSLWIISGTYLKTNNISDISNNSKTKNIIDFSRENITYILVCSSKKNRQEISDKMRKHMASATGKNYNPNKLDYCTECFCFKDAYILDEKELRNFIAQFK